MIDAGYPDVLAIRLGPSALASDSSYYIPSNTAMRGSWRDTVAPAQFALRPLRQSQGGHFMSAMDLIRELERTRDETLRHFSLDERDLVRCYEPGKWPVRYILHHLSDSETVLFDRIRRVLSEPRQVLWVYDQDAWARGLDYSQLPLEISRRVYEAVRSAVIYYAQRFYEDKGHLEFVHSVTGVRTLKDEFDKVASHNEHHLSQIRSALQG
jgi:hypothetical protein